MLCAGKRFLSRRAFAPIAGLLGVFALHAIAVAQQGAVPAPSSVESTVQLTFPPETELRVLIDYVSQRLGLRFLYDEQVANKRISVRAAEPIPTASLLNVLESALKMKGLALIDGDVEGWKRIVAAGDLAQIASTQQNQSLGTTPGATPVTQTFRLLHIGPERLGQIIVPFLTKQGANTISVPDQRLLIVTDYADNLKRIAQLIATIDQPGPERQLKCYEAVHVEAAALAQQIGQSLASTLAQADASAKPVEFAPDPRTNQLMVIGTDRQIIQVLELAKALDVDLGLRTQIYTFRHVDAARVDDLVKELFDPLTVKRLYRSAIDENDNLLIATATESIHERLVWLKGELDVETKRPGSAVKFYRLKYANAQDVFNTLRAMENQTGNHSSDGRRHSQTPNLTLGTANGGAHGTPATPVQLQRTDAKSESPTTATNAVPAPATPATAPTTPLPDAARPPVSGAIPMPIVPGAARLSVDQSSNSIIVVADRAVQQMYADLIERLDRRRPQVMIEAKVVILDTSDDFSLGIELGGDHSFGAKKLLQFTSFGLSTVNPVTGSLSLIPGRAFNWALVDPQNADAVIRAMSSHRRAKVLSSPRILVNDNATGTLASVTEVPFTSVNASNTVATTSFAGFAQAGTTIEATPRISDENYLQLDFSISLNSFTGSGGNGVPPPRQTDQVVSTATIPDGYTVIVGGLTRKSDSSTEEGVPFLEKIPIIKLFASTRTANKSQTTLFVFLRPVILQDDKFRDLKYFSDCGLTCAAEPGNYPASSPLLIK